MRDLINIDNKPIINKINDTDPIYKIKEKEFNEALITFGSFISIIKNKRINQTMLLIEIIENETVRKIFMDITDIDNIQFLIYNLIIRFPILCKSKVIKNKLKELNNDSKRKRLL